MLLVIQKGSQEAGSEKVRWGNERAVYVYGEERKEEEIKGGGGEREWGWVNSEVRSSCLRRRVRPRLPGCFLMSTAAEGEKTLWATLLQYFLFDGVTQKPFSLYVLSLCSFGVLVFNRAIINSETKQTGCRLRIAVSVISGTAAFSSSACSLPFLLHSAGFRTMLINTQEWSRRQKNVDTLLVQM